MARVVGLLGMVLTALGCVGASERTPLDPADRPHRQLVRDGAWLLDVRTPAEYAARHVEGAANIPVQELAARLAEVPRDRPVVLYCATGRRSANAARILREAGITQVHDVGGIGSW